MGKFEAWVEKVDGMVWGIPLIVLILFCGIFLTVHTRGIQFRKLGLALKSILKNETGGVGEVSAFGALCTALSATIGTGSIVGVAGAIAVGGPGAIFWMIVAAFFGMATQYAEGLLALRYRRTAADGHVLGGPFYYIEYGMGSRWRWLGKLFAICGVVAGLFGIGTITQANGITSAFQLFFDPERRHVLFALGGAHEMTVAAVVSGLVVTLLSALVLFGGIKRIAKVSEIVVPFMAILYFLCGILIVIVNLKSVPAALAEILADAFGLRAVVGGGLGTMFNSMRMGVARGVFTNEAGLGSAPIAAAAARTNDPVRQGLVTMTGTFFDTIVICTITGLAVVISGAWQPELGLEGVEITVRAFQQGLPFSEDVSAMILLTGLVFFAFSTIIGWNYYAERCLEYLTGDRGRSVIIFRGLYIFAVLIGPYMTVSAVWNLADIFNAMMALPNLVALIALSGEVRMLTKKAFPEKT